MLSLDRSETISQWFESYGNDVFRFLLYFLRDTKDVDDLLQETFVRAYTAFSRYRGDASPKTWLLQIARNLAVDHIRKGNRDQRTDNEILNTLPSAGKTPEDWVMAIEETKWVLQRLEAINPKYSQILLIRGIQDLSARDAAEVLGWSISKVNVTYHRALKAAQRILMSSNRKQGAGGL